MTDNAEDPGRLVKTNLPKQAERNLAEKVPQHFFMKENKLYVKYDTLQLRRDEEHPGQLLVDIIHQGETLVTQMVPEVPPAGGVLTLYGFEGHTGISLEGN